MNNPKTFIFIGRSGCGKGTQADLLKEYIDKTYPDETTLYIETGENFRKFIKGSGYSNKLSKQIHEDGGLQPEFLAVHIWADILINELDGGENLIIDGTPRKLAEAQIFDTAMKFYGRKKTNVIFINVSREWAFERLKSRGRGDDKSDEDINARLDWYDDEVVPTMEYFKDNPDYNFVDVDGENSIEEVHREIISKI